MKEITESGGLMCANCATPMHGEFCHECGQSIHSVLKPVHGMLEDTLDIVLHVDGRAMHTIPPLLTKPGFLTLEYFSGRRVRYVAPFRLMFVLCLLAFFLGHILLDQAFSKPDHVQAQHGPAASTNAFADATSADDVNKRLDQQVGQLQLARKTTGASAALDLAESALRKQAAQRIAQLDGSAPASAGSALADNDLIHLDEGDKDDFDWLHQPIHVDIAWLPNFMNARLEKGIQHMRLNVIAMTEKGEAGTEAWDRFKAGTFAAVPQTMFVLMPIFALLLKVMYIFRRRLYMEHLIVALHSHAFLFLNLIVGILLSMLASWLVPHAGWLSPVFRLLEWGLAIWALVYLWLMQKRVYRQGWLMTSVKYFVVGWCYLWMLVFALVFAVILGIAH
jgi:Protein of unknown function (DUF3667)